MIRSTVKTPNTSLNPYSTGNEVVGRVNIPILNTLLGLNPYSTGNEVVGTKRLEF